MALATTGISNIGKPETHNVSPLSKRVDYTRQDTFTYIFGSFKKYDATISSLNICHREIIGDRQALFSTQMTEVTIFFKIRN